MASKNGEVAPQVQGPGSRTCPINSKRPTRKWEELQTRKSAEDAQKTVDRIKGRGEEKGRNAREPASRVRVELKVEFDN